MTSEITNQDDSLVDCVYYLSGCCSKGESCTFRHFEATLTNFNTCKFWVQGSCNNTKCLFRHPKIKQKADPSKTICFYFTQGACSKTDCPYLHEIPQHFVSQNLLQKQLQLQQEEIKKIGEMIKNTVTPKVIQKESVQLFTKKGLEEFEKEKEIYSKKGKEILEKYSSKKSFEKNKDVKKDKEKEKVLKEKVVEEKLDPGLEEIKKKNLAKFGSKKQTSEVEEKIKPKEEKTKTKEEKSKTKKGEEEEKNFNG